MKPLICDENAQFVREILGKASDELCYWKTFWSPTCGMRRCVAALLAPGRLLDVEICYLSRFSVKIPSKMGRDTCRSLGDCWIYMSAGRNVLPKFMPISFFRRASRL